MKIFQDDCFKNKNYFISGSGSGIGQSLSLKLLSSGANVFGVGRNIEKLKTTETYAKDLAGKFYFAAGDLRKPDVVKSLVSDAVSQLKQIDGLVNNAGGQFPSLLENLSPNGWNSVIDNNLNGPFYVAREVFHQWMKANGGVIINMVAECRNGMSQMGHSGAARAGTINFTMTASVEWAKYNIRVNGIAPGIIESSGLETYPEDFKSTLEKLKNRIPMKRFGRLDEIVDPILFLLSPAATFANGMILEIDGGQRLIGPM